MAEIVRLTVVPDEGAAEILCGLLRSEGIRCMQRVSNVGAGAADAAWAFGGWREILVDRDDAGRASELLAASQDPDATDAPPEELGSG